MGKSTINGGANGKMIYFHGDSTTIFWFYDILILKFGKLINWDGTSPTVGRIMDSTNPQPQLSSGSPAWGAWISMKHQLISHIYKSGVYIYMIIYIYIYTIYHISYIIYHIYIYNISYIIYHIYIYILYPIESYRCWPLLATFSPRPGQFPQCHQRLRGRTEAHALLVGWCSWWCLAWEKEMYRDLLRDQSLFNPK